MKLIPLTKGYFAKVDDSDFDELIKFKWRVDVRNGISYALRGHYYKKVNGIKSMHRQLLGFPDSDIDHVDCDGLNNQRFNLRKATDSQNSMNRRVFRHSTEFKGVSFYKPRGTYRARITASGMLITLGYFTTPEEAASAYDCAADHLFGDYARTNQQMGAL